ncbi:MAG: hypothetical protein L0207_03835 [Chlamydiae bacterium]|nr:hypothetical protein [Chlamydiota bacterium]
MKNKKIFFLIFSSLCIFLSFFTFFQTIRSANDLKTSVQTLIKKSKSLIEQTNLEASLSEKERNYVSKYLESLLFLESEIKRLDILVQAEPENEFFKKRLDYLKSEANRFKLIEKATHEFGAIQEMELSLAHPIELDGEDLKKLLCFIEGVKIEPFEPLKNRPELIIKKLEISKKTISPEEEVYVIQELQLIKRERS